MKGELNVDLLRRVQERIRRDQRFDMRTFFHPCGTPACIAGHVIVEAGGGQVAGPSVLALNLIGWLPAVTWDTPPLIIDGQKRVWLFFRSTWPPRFKEQIRAGLSEREVAVDLLDWIVQEWEREVARRKLDSEWAEAQHPVEGVTR